MREFSVPQSFSIPENVSMADSVFRHAEEDPTFVPFKRAVERWMGRRHCS